MARKAAKQLMKKTGANPDDIDLVIVATSTPAVSYTHLLYYHLIVTLNPLINNSLT